MQLGYNARMTTTTVTLDPEKQARARRYALLRRYLWLAETLFSLLYAVAWLTSGWAARLRDVLLSRTTNELILVAAFLVVYGGVYALLTLPLGYYGSFVLPHRFDQSTQTLKDWLIDQLKGLLIAAPLGLLMMELVYLALRLTGDAWWLWTTAGMLLFGVILGNLAPVLIMPLFNKFIPLEEEHADLAARLIALAEKAHTRVRGVYKFDMSRRTKAANAALTGIGNTRRIILGDTLIDEFTPDEIEAVLAHELGHHVNRDMPILMLSGTLITALGLYLASLIMKSAVAAFGFYGVADVAAFPALMLVMQLYGLISQPLTNAISRWRERLADEYALRATNNGEAFATAFIRLANQNLGEVDPPRWVVWMFYSHPPLKQRIQQARAWKPTNV